MLGGKALLQDKKTGTVTAKQAGPTTLSYLILRTSEKHTR